MQPWLVGPSQAKPSLCGKISPIILLLLMFSLSLNDLGRLSTSGRCRTRPFSFHTCSLIPIWFLFQIQAVSNQTFSFWSARDIWACDVPFSLQGKNQNQNTEVPENIQVECTTEANRFWQSLTDVILLSSHALYVSSSRLCSSVVLFENEDTLVSLLLFDWLWEPCVLEWDCPLCLQCWHLLLFLGVFISFLKMRPHALVSHTVNSGPRFFESAVCWYFIQIVAG